MMMAVLTHAMLKLDGNAYTLMIDQCANLYVVMVSLLSLSYVMIVTWIIAMAAHLNV